MREARPLSDQELRQRLGSVCVHLEAVGRMFDRGEAEQHIVHRVRTVVAALDALERAFVLRALERALREDDVDPDRICALLIGR